LDFKSNKSQIYCTTIEMLFSSGAPTVGTERLPRLECVPVVRHFKDLLEY